MSDNQCSCGFIIAERNEKSNRWLLCHPTNGGQRWDFPKGLVDDNEDHLVTAIRELEEETGLILILDDDNVIDLGQHNYRPKKDLHLFYIELKKININELTCRSMVNLNEQSFPEMDAFGLFNIKDVRSKVCKNLLKWISTNVPSDLLVL